MEVWGEINSVLEAHADVTNNNSNALKVQVKKIENSLVSGTLNYFCWYQCYTENTYVSPDSVQINAGATSNLFVGDYLPQGNWGTSYITYVFFDAMNPNDSAYFIAEYNARGVGLNEIPLVAKISNAYPNPANDFIYFDYSIPKSVVEAKVIVRDIIGNNAREIELGNQEGTIRIETGDLKDGVYFYTILLDETVFTTKKLVIKH